MLQDEIVEAVLRKISKECEDCEQREKGERGTPEVGHRERPLALFTAG